MAKEGLSIKHTRVDEIENEVTSQKCTEYQNLGFFCPSGHSPVSLSEYGKLHKTCKSEVLNCLQEKQKPCYGALQDVGMIVNDGATLVHMNPPKHSKTFREYCNSELGEKLMKIEVPVNQLDFVLDVYREELKGETWEGKGNAVHVSVNDSTPIYSGFKKFLRHNDKKKNCFR